MKIRIAARAKRELKRIDHWWRTNRDAKELFLDEFQAVVSLISEHPTIGNRYYEASRDEVRRVLMGRTRHHIYYAEDGDTLVIVSVWSAVRGRGPKL